MRKFLIFAAVIFMFLCGINQSNTANYYNAQTITVQIETTTDAYKTSDNQNDKYFTSNNIQTSQEILFEGFGSTENDYFDVNNLFTNYKNNLKPYSFTDVYLLSFSSVPRAP